MVFTKDFKQVTIAVADDKSLFRETLCAIIDTWENCKVILQAADGQQLLDKLNPRQLPDLVLIDVAMPVLNGFATLKVLKEKFPDIKLMAISLYYSKEMLGQLIKCGARGYVNKKDDTYRLRKAVSEMMNHGYFFSDHTASRMVKNAIQTGVLTITNDLTEIELLFLKYCCSDKTYPKIANEMNVSRRHVEYLRTSLFERFGVKSRTKLAVIALQKGLVILPS